VIIHRRGCTGLSYRRGFWIRIRQLIGRAGGSAGLNDIKGYRSGLMSHEVETGRGEVVVSKCGVDDDYVLDWCPWKQVSDLQCEFRPNNPEFRAFNSDIQRAYGGHAVAAWHGKTLVGILTFHPEGTVRPPEGWEYPRPCALSPTSCRAYRSALDLGKSSGTLVMGCVSVYTGDDDFRRRGVATAMVTEALEWGAGKGFTRVVAYARQPSGNPEDWENSADPETSFWERSGFQAIRTVETPGGARVLMERSIA